MPSLENLKYIEKLPGDKYKLTMKIQAFTPYTIGTPEAFKDFLRSVREIGYAIEDEEGETNIRCIGAPIYDNTGRVAAAIRITALRNELPSIKYGEVGKLVRDKALLISGELG